MASSSDSPLAFLRNNPVYSGLSDAFNSFQERRAKLGLSNPGTVETIARGASLPPCLSRLVQIAPGACFVMAFCWCLVHQVRKLQLGAWTELTRYT